MAKTNKKWATRGFSEKGIASKESPSTKQDDDIFELPGSLAINSDIPTVRVKGKDERPPSIELLYRRMLLIRLFEERVAAMYSEGYIYGFCHLYCGQEAVVVGINANLNTKLDSQITSYREHGHMLTIGVDPKYIMAELCGRETGCSGGRGGSMHMYCREHNFYGGNGIVGAQVPIGTGLALGHKYKNDSGVAVIYFGDGALNQGQVYESFNMAALWGLPAVYVIENNKYALGTAASRSIAGDITTRGSSFGIPCIQADGMDLFDVTEKSMKAIQHARSGKGPIILHVDTYRYKGHSMSDPATYRSREEVEDIRKNRDPLKNIMMKIPDLNYKEIEIEIIKTINEAAEFAISSEVPSKETLGKHVLCEA